jgi:MinD superfamily P-loop ATPase
MNYVTAEERSILIEVIHSRCDLCGCCVGVCPEDALELNNKELKIIELRCTSCCKCVWSCPVEALLFNSER